MYLFKLVEILAIIYYVPNLMNVQLQYRQIYLFDFDDIAT